MELLEKETHISIFYDAQDNWLYVNWTGDQDLETVQDGCGRMLELVRQKKVAKVLNDNQQVTSSWSDAANWGGKVWFPAMRAAGVKFFAWIYSPVIYSKLSTDLSIAYSDEGPKINTFSSLEQAAAWLRTQ